MTDYPSLSAIVRRCATMRESHASLLSITALKGPMRSLARHRWATLAHVCAGRGRRSAHSVGEGSGG
jgi:hypothetical protein